MKEFQVHDGSSYVADENDIPELNRLTFTNICREIDMANGSKPSIHKADFEPGEYQVLRKEGKTKR